MKSERGAKPKEYRKKTFCGSFFCAAAEGLSCCAYVIRFNCRQSKRCWKRYFWKLGGYCDKEFSLGEKTPAVNNFGLPQPKLSCNKAVLGV